MTLTKQEYLSLYTSDLDAQAADAWASAWNDDAQSIAEFIASYTAEDTQS